MPDQRFNRRLSVRVSDADFAAVEQFWSDEDLASTSEALRLVIEIALETVSAKGQRFSNKSSFPFNDRVNINRLTVARRQRRYG